MEISKNDLRNFYVNYHGFYDFFNMPSSVAIAETFNRLQSIQFDPLNVVGRNAELALFSRIENFSRQDLFNALYSDKTLIDGWDKMMCVFARKDFSRFSYVREQMSEDYIKVINWRAQTDCLAFLQEIYDYIQCNGPVLVSDIPSAKTNNGRWGPSKIAGVCCEYLWFGGKIVVEGKKGVVKIYDTAKNVLGEEADKNFFVDKHSFSRWYVKRRISAMGALWNKNGGGWLGPFLENKEYRTRIIEELVSCGELLEINVEGVKEPFYICSGDEKYIKKCEADRAVFIAPLDNLIWDRKLVKNIFDFDYTWEVYVPAAKRKFGYYVLPVMIGDRFVGRFEPCQYRRNETLKIKNFWFESDYSRSVGDIEKIMTEFERLAKFLDVELDSSVRGVVCK